MLAVYVVVTARCHVDVKSFSGVPSLTECHESYVKLNGTVIFNYPTSACVGKGKITPGAARGTNIHLIDVFACSMIEYRNFDTHYHATESDRLRDYLDDLDEFAVITGHVLGGAQNELQNDAYDAFSRVGVDVYGLEYGGSFAFVTQKSTNKTVLDKALTGAESSVNPAHVKVMITGM